MTRTLVWRGLDEPRMEIAHVDSFQRARGTQIGLAYELRWALDGDLLRVAVVGTEEREFALGDADFFDLGYSPFFNSLPVMRDGLLDAAPARDYRMRFVNAPSLTDVLSEQRYEPRGGRVVRYRSGSFEADIEFDAHGFVTLYHGFLERVG
ncbi:MAG TPA: putative glycolipid-binding domain-containing protein [Gaiellaceae bacterium]|nr:putative glycolipid-binding domain-containing protein [Gaiellaceae bacterium]